MDVWFSILSFFVSALMAYLLMPWLLHFCNKRGLYDIPNSRKVHQNKIPRLGGVLFMPCALVGVATSVMVMMYLGVDLPLFTASAFLILVGIFMIYLVGILDDVLGLPARLKFLIQFVTALFLPLCNLYINNLYGFLGIYEIPMYIGYPLTIFVCLLIVNSINLIDGIDGLASGLSLIALGAFTLIFFQLNAIKYALFPLGLMGAVSVFFYFNMFGKVEKSTKTFMGDTGSLILGYALSFFAIKMVMDNEHVLPYREGALMISYSLLLVPTFDLIRVALSRLKRGVSIFHADKTHIHHKFLAAGFSMHQTLAAIIGLQLGFCLLNFFLFSWDVSTTLIVLGDVVLFAVMQYLLTRNARISE
ncbi:undecaprenyl-phosphate alpha-N-acetylglucosaminyltransferase [gut metagenome]|uniref:Undecaprenyl-phosphate alpha-N-acetylglucosaminyltransferase n=1 Tax=gut metagenome TaxID=749906 RepID=J9H435_9ZZZZ